jgi:hypothetical protein
MLFAGKVAVSQQPSAPLPLNEDEQRLVLDQLIKCEASFMQLKGYQDFVADNVAQRELIKAEYTNKIELQNQEIQLAKEATKQMEEKYNLEKERSKFYEDMYKLVTHKPGLRCRILSAIFTLGMYSCK